MSKYSGTSFSVLLVDGYNLAASITENATIAIESVTQQTNPFGVGSEGHTPINIEKGVLSAGGGFFDATVDALHSAIGTVIGIARIVSATLEGNVIGRHFFGFQGAYSQKYEVMDAKDGLTKANVVYQVTGDVDEGVIVQHLATFTADWDTKTGGAGAPDAPVDNANDGQQRVYTIASNSLANPTVVTMSTQHGSPILHNLTTGDKVFFSGSNSTPSINGLQTVTVLTPTTFTVPVNVTVAGTAGTFVKASTNAGGVGYQHVTAFSGFTGFIGKIMHSPDDVTYAALVTFANATGLDKQRIVVAGNVDRYLSFNGDVTGAGSITVFGGFSRY